MVEFFLRSVQSSFHDLFFKVFLLQGELQLFSSSFLFIIFPQMLIVTAFYTRKLFVSQQSSEMQQDQDWKVPFIDVLLAFFVHMFFLQTNREEGLSMENISEYLTVIFELKAILEFKNTIRGICKFLFPSVALCVTLGRLEHFKISIFIALLCRRLMYFKLVA